MIHAAKGPCVLSATVYLWVPDLHMSCIDVTLEQGNGTVIPISPMMYVGMACLKQRFQALTVGEIQQVISVLRW